MANPIKSLKKSLGQTPTRYRFWASLGILAALLIALPVTLIGLMTGTFELRKRATTSEPPKNSITWKTDRALVQAEGFYIVVNNQSFNANVGEVTVRSDPGSYYYTTLEATWRENEREMRLFMYFYGDETHWWVEEIRTYNGQDPGDWVIYQGPYFKSLRGLPFQFGDYYLTPYNNPGAGLIRLSNFTIQPFFQNLFPSCGQSCSSSQQCDRGLACGSPCPPGLVCIKELFCYNPTCPYDKDCICGAIPTPTACVGECGTAIVYPDAPDCCPGLEKRGKFQIDNEGNCQPLFGGNICLGSCGDGQCLSCEDHCNCPEDCLPTSTTPTPTSTPILIPTSTPTGISLIVIKIRFDGVTSRPLDDSFKEIGIYATSLTGGPDLGSATNRYPVTVSVDDLGVYSGEISLNGSYFGHRYRFRIKGPKHLQSVFPDVYFQAGGELDLTYSPLRPGDLDQDGDTDLTDLRSIKVFSKDSADIAYGDVNFDNRVDIFDKILVLNTLSVQYDPD